MDVFQTRSECAHKENLFYKSSASKQQTYLNSSTHYRNAGKGYSFAIRCADARGFSVVTLMLIFQSTSIYLHREPVDFRKSINGLSALVQESMALDVFSASLFVFGNRGRDKIKILFWDKTGFCLFYKRLERDKFKWPRKGDAVLSLCDWS